MDAEADGFGERRLLVLSRLVEDTSTVDPFEQSGDSENHRHRLYNDPEDDQVSQYAICGPHASIPSLYCLLLADYDADRDDLLDAGQDAWRTFDADRWPTAARHGLASLRLLTFPSGVTSTTCPCVAGSSSSDLHSFFSSADSPGLINTAQPRPTSSSLQRSLEGRSPK